MAWTYGKQASLLPALLGKSDYILPQIKFLLIQLAEKLHINTTESQRQRILKMSICR